MVRGTKVPAADRASGGALIVNHLIRPMPDGFPKTEGWKTMRKSREIGDRVGALMKGEKGTVWVFGYGTYQGDQVPDPALGVRFLGGEMDHPNPCILLDSGKQVFGCECWWGPEEATRERYKDLKWVLVSIDDLRAGLKDD